jgi:hypothetical protein
MMQTPTASRTRHAKRHTKQLGPRNRQAMMTRPVWLQTALETASLYVLPVTLLILIVLIVLGISGNMASLEPGSPQPSSLLAFEAPSIGGDA